MLDELDDFTEMTLKIADDTKTSVRQWKLNRTARRRMLDQAGSFTEMRLYRWRNSDARNVLVLKVDANTTERTEQTRK